MTAVSFLFLLTACVHSRNIVYFHDLEDTTGVHVQDSIRNFQALIEPGDILDIYVNSLNPQASAIFNLGNSAQSPSVAQGSGSGQGAALNTDATSGLIRGYKVEQDGTIDFPVLGKMTVAGLTTTTLRDSLKMRLNDYLKVPVVDVRFLNYKITVLGEVAKPATYVISSGKSTIMDLLGMAGDLTIYGRRDNIMVIREQGGKRTFARLDLTSSKVFDSPYYFLKQNDVVYVEPTRAKVVASDDKFVRTVSILGAVLGLVVSLVIVFKY
jgi:polysaccharide export outer membrane protein